MKQALKNLKVVIPRPIEQADEFSNKLIELGAEPILFPLIKVEAINKKPLVKLFNNNSFDWIIFTSSAAVRFFFDVISPNEIKNKIAVVGTQTQKVVESYGLKVTFVPSAATAKKLVKEIPLNKGEKVLIPRSKIAGNAIIDLLKKRGINVTIHETYNNTPIEYDIDEIHQKINVLTDYITFTSASTVKGFYKQIKKAGINILEQKLVSIGPSTTKAANDLGIKIDATAETHNVEGLIEAIIKLENE